MNQVEPLLSIPDFEAEPMLVSHDVWAFHLPIYGTVMHESLCYVIGGSDGRVVLVDPGVREPKHVDLVARALEHIGRGLDDLSGIVATHLHNDHLGLAAQLRELSGAPIMLSFSEQETLRTSAEDSSTAPELLARWGVPIELREMTARAMADSSRPGLEADVLLDDGDLIPVAGRALRVLATPGHTSGHIALRLDEDSVLFAGDHVLPHMSSGIGLSGAFPENPLLLFLRSLARVATFDDDTICPGHGHVFTGIAKRCAELSERLRKRNETIARARAAAPSQSVWDLAHSVQWRYQWQTIGPAILRSTLLQTQMHVDLLEEFDASRRAALWALTPPEFHSGFRGGLRRNPGRSPTG